MEKRETPFVKLRFKCYFGVSQIARPRDATYGPRGEVSDELDEFCLRKRLISEAAVLGSGGTSMFKNTALYS